MQRFWACDLGIWSTHSTHQNLGERNRVSLFFINCDSAGVGFRQWCSVKTRSTGKLDRVSRRSWRCGLSKKNQCFLLWQSDLENGVQPASEVDFFFTCVNQKLTSLSESTCSDPRAKINHMICFIHGPIVSAACLVPTLKFVHQPGSY